MVAICVDASLVLAWLLPEELSDAAFSLGKLWDEEETELIAPPLVQMEVPSSLRQAVYRGRITLDEGDEALKAFLEMDIRIRQPEGLLGRAWELGKAVNAPRLYDIFYLALAEMEGCELWTADRRLVNLAGSHSATAKWIGDIPTEATDG
jgi:predicted nucleic acid-binding protein